MTMDTVDHAISIAEIVFLLIVANLLVFAFGFESAVIAVLAFTLWKVYEVEAHVS